MADYERQRLQHYNDNDEDVDRLRQKVARLKDVTIEIQGEVNEQNRFLTDMQQNFDDLSARLGRLVASVKEVALSGSSNGYLFYAICILVLLLVFIFFFR